MISAERSVLVIIDLQTRLLPALAGHEALVQQAQRLIKIAKLLDIPILFLEENPSSLGPTLNSLLDLAPLAPVYSKMAFGCAEEPFILQEFLTLRGQNRDHLVMAGAEAHVCVMQTALGLSAKGFHVAVVCDAVGSRRILDKDIALIRMANAGLTMLSVEMIAFEWLRTASAPPFKSLLELVR